MKICKRWLDRCFYFCLRWIQVYGYSWWWVTLQGIFMLVFMLLVILDAQFCQITIDPPIPKVSSIFSTRYNESYLKNVWLFEIAKVYSFIRIFLKWICYWLIRCCVLLCVKINDIYISNLHEPCFQWILKIIRIILYGTFCDQHNNSVPTARIY